MSKRASSHSQPTSLSEVFVRDLLVIDDAKLRLDSFREAEQVLRKIEKLEIKIEKFYSEDQRLFESWFHLTFRPQLARQEQLNDEYKSLAIFHNRILALAQSEDCSLPEAFGAIKKLQGALAEPSTSQIKRDEIQAFFLNLDRLIDDEMIKKRGDGISEDFSFEAEDQNEADSESKNKSDQSDPTMPKTYREFKSWDDERIRKEMGKGYDSHAIFETVLDAADRSQDEDLVLKFWDLASPKFQVHFAKAFESKSGIPFPPLIEKLRQIKKLKKASQKEIPHNGTSTGLPKSETHSKSESDTVAEEESERLSSPQERLKLLYRQLVRKIHPDFQNEEVSPSMRQWMKKIWTRLQKAYHGKDLHELEKIFALTLLQLKDLKSLTFSEIRQAQSWLNEEFQDMQRDSGNLKSKLSWGFSTKKSYATLAKKIAKELKSSMDETQERIDELRELHFRLASSARRSRSNKSSHSRRR